MIRIDLPWQTPPADANRALRSVAPHARAAADKPCEQCVFVPTPDGKCVCREGSES